jgi:sulfate transport system substrate-binding protein
MKSRALPPTLLLVLIGLVLSACGAASGAAVEGAAEASTLTLVAYSTPREAYDELTQSFAETAAGAGVGFETSYGSSGEQSRAVEQGLAADVVALSLEPDITRLVKAGMVAEDWSQDEYKGMVTNSVVVLAVREGNPKGIKSWDDLVKPDVEVITPNPFTSGGAKWNVMAAYGSQIKQGKSEQEATEYLRAMFRNVAVQDKSAREALTTFTGGKGDVMLAYENEVITAQQKGEKLEYVVPAETILIQNPVAVVTDSKHGEKARAFVDYLRTPEAQRVFGQKGYRPVVADVLEEFKQYKDPARLFTIDEFNGWSAVNEKFFDPEQSVMADIERERGVDPASK